LENVNAVRLPVSAVCLLEWRLWLVKKKILLYILIVIITSVWSLPALVLADELKTAQQKKSSIDSQISSILKQKQEEAKKKKELESQKKTLESKQAEESKQYQQLVNEINLLNEEIIKVDEALRDAEENYDAQRELLKTRLRAMYENSNNSILKTLLCSKSVTDFFEKLELMAIISKNDNQLVEDLKAAKLDVEYKKQLKEEKKEEIQSRASEKQEKLSELKASRSELEAQIKKSQSELAKLDRQEDELVKESDKLINYIKNLSKNKKYAGGSMTWPLPSSKKVVSQYGMRRHPILKKYKMHTGIDIDGDKGDSIVAANKGTVIIAKWQNGYGNTVVVDHGGGISTLYAHCSKILVKVGAEVKAGQVIAKVGSTGLATGPHLHFEVRKDGKTKNPLDYISP